MYVRDERPWCGDKALAALYRFPEYPSNRIEELQPRNRTAQTAGSPHTYRNGADE